MFSRLMHAMILMSCWEKVSFTHQPCVRDVAAATAAKSPQSCPTLCDPIDSSPPGSPTHVRWMERERDWCSYVHAWWSRPRRKEHICPEWNSEGAHLCKPLEFTKQPSYKQKHPSPPSAPEALRRELDLLLLGLWWTQTSICWVPSMCQALSRDIGLTGQSPWSYFISLKLISVTFVLLSSL